MINYAEEYVRCLKDKTRTYFIENYLYTFDATVRKKYLLNYFQRQKGVFEKFVIITIRLPIKHRQAGITTISAAWFVVAIVFASKNLQKPYFVLQIN